MGKNKNATKPLTHEEIWDDSALVRSWDEAVEEYKLYHSIHAKGENVEDVLREAQASEPADQEINGDDYMETEADAPGVDSTVDISQQAEAETESNIQPAQEPEGDSQIPAMNPVGAGTIPQPALDKIQDEGLKNLMMSWYFAGYYTGLYEGQQRATQNKNP
ncbi:hypothetical protein PHISCL_02151 [Aspergillus sclerotialis]|uniref:Survival Motor Neuron Gemin2-binding domain-containing protein n=1 Tax=Aspergillus sclerotialis TaxID=2070753 RepID=A0A3A2ZQV4_9EURO|nr:hypothetical protein PHISCL_02151 [Aspergillus sclerotialis]